MKFPLSTSGGAWPRRLLTTRARFDGEGRRAYAIRVELTARSLSQEGSRMDHPEHAPHAAVENPFTPTEQAAFHADDWAAGRNIVVLMLGIFIIGVCLYLVVDYFAFYWTS